MVKLRLTLCRFSKSLWVWTAEPRRRCAHKKKAAGVASRRSLIQGTWLIVRRFADRRLVADHRLVFRVPVFRAPVFRAPVFRDRPVGRPPVGRLAVRQS